MTRFRLTLEYDGSGFLGWQRQAGGQTVQDAVEEAVFRFCGERPAVHAAGRTDAGVHAFGQVAHVDIARPTPAPRVADALNFHLKPHPVAVIDCVEAAPGFHARFQAIERRYLYRIANRRPPLTLDRGHAWRISTRLDAAAMHEAAQVLVGHHDFTSFRSTDCQAKSPVKTLDELTVTRLGGEIEIAVRARSFLHHQVRNIVGTLKLVGEGKWTRRGVEKALAARDRTAAGPTAPADGLYLVAVRYPAPGEAAAVALDGDRDGGE